MKRRLTHLVAVLCLLAFFVSSAACLTVAAPEQMSTANHIHTVDASGHACCPGHSSDTRQVSNACCTVHHQPASVVVVTELHQLTTTSLAVFPLPAPLDVMAHASADPRAALPQQPPLIALRI